MMPQPAPAALVVCPCGKTVLAGPGLLPGSITCPRGCQERARWAALLHRAEMAGVLA